MTPFVIVADMRTGSTLLATSLDSHPDIRCYGELFHPDNLPDNQIEGYNRYELSGRELAERAFHAQDSIAAGFRAMIFLPMPSQPQWADAWDCLHDRAALRVIYLTRRNRLAQYASMLVAQKTGAYHPHDGDPVLKPTNRPTITIDPARFQDWKQQRDELLLRRRRELAGKPSLELQLEALTARWEAATARVQEFLGVVPRTLAQAKRKQERRPLSEVIANYREVAHWDAEAAG